MLFSDIAATIDGLGLADLSKALLNWVLSRPADRWALSSTKRILHQTQLFKGFTNKGIIIKIVKSQT